MEENIRLDRHKTYNCLKRLKICVSCHTNTAEDGYVHCSSCRTRINARRRERMQDKAFRAKTLEYLRKYRANGYKSSNVKLKDEEYNKTTAEKQRVYHKKYYAEHKEKLLKDRSEKYRSNVENGLCRLCGTPLPSDSAYKSCEKCRKDNAYTRLAERRLIAGLCVKCGRPKTIDRGNMKTCKICSGLSKKSMEKSRARRKEEIERVIGELKQKVTELGGGKLCQYWNCMNHATEGSDYCEHHPHNLIMVRKRG